VMQSVQRLISDCAARNIFAISRCTGLQNWWLLMRWKKDWRIFWILNFLPLYISENVLKSWWKQRLLSQDL
jgi:hypothetical protein